MATITVTPDDGVTVGRIIGGAYSLDGKSRCNIKFPKNTTLGHHGGSGEITYTITYDSGNGCTGETTYTVPGGCKDLDGPIITPTGSTAVPTVTYTFGVLTEGSYLMCSDCYSVYVIANVNDEAAELNNGSIHLPPTTLSYKLGQSAEMVYLLNPDFSPLYSGSNLYMAGIMCDNPNCVVAQEIKYYANDSIQNEHVIADAGFGLNYPKSATKDVNGTTVYYYVSNVSGGGGFIKA